MQLSIEGAKSRWLVMAVVWTAVAWALFLHASTVRNYLAIAGNLGLRGAPAAATPLRQAYPAFAADSQVWVRHALSLLEGNGPRLRFTKIDNAPHGREVHWNSAWAWSLASAGLMDHWLTRKPLGHAVEDATLWLPSVTLFVLTVLISAWVARRVGALAGAVVAIAMVGHPRVYEGFFPSYADHHGLLTVAVLGMMVGATLMGAGWWQDRPVESLGLLPRSRESTRNAAVGSAISGALGLWVSAASTIPPIAIVAFAGLVALFIQGRRALQQGANFDGGAWRLWGRVGAAASLLFYLVEYFPFHLGFRLESNHPFYALAWWGGGELIAQIGERFLSNAKDRWANLKPVVLPLLCVAIAPLTIAIAGTKVFIVIDPFLSLLHSRYIQEFLPLWRSIQGTGWKTFFSVVGTENIPLIAAVILLFVRGRLLPLSIWFGALAALAFTAMAWVQSRWLLNASGAQVCLAVTLLIYFLADKRAAVRWSVGIVAAGLVFASSAVTRIVGGRDDVAARRVSPKDAQSALWRDIAVAIRQSQPTGPITLLASPNGSTLIGYYGGFKTLGTLYWENAAGLKSAAAILAARSPEEAAALIKKSGVTHIAVVSEEHFIDSYYRLLHPGASDEEIRKCFGLQLLIDRIVPVWLEMLPYTVPPDLAPLKISVLLFKVAFDQTPADALYHIALAKIAAGSLAEAERDLDVLIQQSPASYQPWIHKGEILFKREDWDAAVETSINGIKRAPASSRMELFGTLASSFYRKGKSSQTARIYRAALEESFAPDIAAYLAFVLSTAKDDKVRDGAAAVELAERALKSQPNSPTVLNSLAAALAETGAYEKAVEIASRALANARMNGEAAAIAVTEQRLAAYRAGKPWRE